MEQTKPLVILRKYRSILFAAAIVEAVTFLVSLTDSIVAGNMVSDTAFTAIGLMAPFASISTFLAATVNSGTVLSFSENIGAFQKRRAHEFLNQGNRAKDCRHDQRQHTHEGHQLHRRR